ncbi:MAG: aminopeptidase P family protein [Clostridiaceae bacterium]|jgi:Xaa-Pro aminopeptidase|nr:aminopeptidase P family protein [Clostridiaceae bacterium]
MKSIRDDFRIKRLKDKMREYNVDYLILRLPENVLYSTGYWPIFGASMAVVPYDGEPTIFYIEGEDDFAEESWVEDLRSYVYFGMEEMINPNRNFSRMLKELWKEKGYNKKGVIGYEGGFEFIATQNISCEARIPGEPGMKMLKEVFPDATFVDAFNLLREARTVKSKIEIELMRRACEVTCMGYAAAREVVVPGVKDCEVSAAVEAAIRSKGVGYKGARRARGYAFALSGEKSSMHRNPYFVTSDRVMKEGDTTLIELDAYVDGYFCDMTRTMAAGKPSQKAQELWGIVHEELEAMLNMIKPGVHVRDMCQVAKDIAAKYGYNRKENFVHQPGHGIGLQFHEPPSVHLLSDEVLEEGMVLSLEPHLYIPGWGGMRMEENVVVTQNGYELLTIFPRNL